MRRAARVYRGELAPAQADRPLYKCVDKAENELGEKGMAYLCKGQWGMIEGVKLGIKEVT